MLVRLWGKRNLFIAGEASMEISMGVLQNIQNITYGPALSFLSIQVKDSKLTLHTHWHVRDTHTDTPEILANPCLLLYNKREMESA